MGKWGVYLVKYYITITMWMFHRPSVHRDQTLHWELLWNMGTRSTENGREIDAENPLELAIR
jgi:hypothetical protein